MEQELSYSFHLGSDKNKSKVAKKVSKGNVSGTTSLSNNDIQNANDLSRVNKHNLRDYDNQRELITTIYGTNDIVEDVKQVYLEEFEQARTEYNAKTRADRQIKDYFQKVCNSQNDVACEIIIELGDMDFWQYKDNEYRYKMTDVYNEQIQEHSIFDKRLKEIDNEYLACYINRRKYPIIIFAMSKIMEMNNNQQNQIAMYLYNNV